MGSGLTIDINPAYRMLCTLVAIGASYATVSRAVKRYEFGE